MIKPLRIAWKQWRCDHFWRPARSKTLEHHGIIEYGQPSKFCDQCNKVVPLTLAEFYAQFGRMPW